jgi:23S rRNA (pseudouridine1915-N3)-methyltransferase
MLNIVILAVGKIKTKYFNEAADEYLKRLGPYTKIFIEEIESEPFARESDKERTKKREGERLAKALEKYSDSIIFLLDARGKQFSSVSFADFLNEQNERIVFVIGGVLGFSGEFLGRKYKKIALSEMTLPHELARVVLLEQIYRAAAILGGRTYHY